MRPPISIEEESMTATERLVRAIGLLNHPLMEADREDIIGAGLAEESDFEESPDPYGRDDGQPVYGYIGTRWTVHCHNGRTRLVEAIEVPPASPGPATDRAEQAFSLAIHMIERLSDRPMEDNMVAAIRRDGWANAFRRAAERDAAGGDRPCSGEGEADDGNPTLARSIPRRIDDLKNRFVDRKATDPAQPRAVPHLPNPQPNMSKVRTPNPHYYNPSTRRMPDRHGTQGASPIDTRREEQMYHRSYRIPPGRNNSTDEMKCERR